MTTGLDFKARTRSKEALAEVTRWIEPAVATGLSGHSACWPPIDTERFIP